MIYTTSYLYSFIINILNETPVKVNQREKLHVLFKH
ncbi:hypothetical protein D0396_02295 [Staphylococcus epidermidis]|nr:hypothetical protein [Staphylococcus epidermidis]